MFENAPPKIVERRIGKDRKEKAASALDALSWLFWVVGIYLISFAVPGNATFFDVLYGKVVRTSWIPIYLYITEISWGVGIIVCLIKVFLVKDRRRRKTDRTGILMAISLVVNLLSIILMIVFVSVYG